MLDGLDVAGERPITLDTRSGCVGKRETLRIVGG